MVRTRRSARQRRRPAATPPDDRQRRHRGERRRIELEPAEEPRASIRAHPRILVDDLAIALADRHRDDLAFPSSQGGVLRNRNARRDWFDDAAAAAIGEPGLTPHELRHTAASLAVSAEANVKAVQRMLGHASAAMTLDRYADLFDDDLDAVAERLDAVARTAREFLADFLRTEAANVYPITRHETQENLVKTGLSLVGDTGIEPVTPAV